MGCPHGPGPMPQTRMAAHFPAAPLCFGDGYRGGERLVEAPAHTQL